ncbi:MAG: toll/interleukin-1 receptor domain-containing protein [Actinomycetes bacterium]
MASVFFSYSHDDEQYRDQLEKHLASLKHQGLVESWHDRRILAGADVDKEIDSQLERADVILLLVSSSFLSSRYCYGIEMQRALERHITGEATVIPVIVRPCDWKTTKLGHLLALPLDGKPITTWPNFDEAYTGVAQGVRDVILGRSETGKAHSAAPAVPPGPAAMPVSRSLPRSSNLRLRRAFTDSDKDTFLHESFEFVAQFFEGSLQELQARHSDIECRYRRIDANTFTASIYRDGTRKAECSVGFGGGFRHGGITYSHNVSSRGNSYNEMLSVEHDDQTLFLKPLGLSFQPSRDEKLSMEQAAEHYWQMLIASLQ